MERFGPLLASWFAPIPLHGPFHPRLLARSSSYVDALMEDGERGTAIRPALKRLMEKDCLVKRERGTYSFFTPLFGEYVKARVMSA